MHFAYPLPWWLAVILAAAIGASAYAEYRRPLSPLTPRQRGLLIGLLFGPLRGLLRGLLRRMVCRLVRALLTLGQRRQIGWFGGAVCG